MCIRDRPYAEGWCSSKKPYLIKQKTQGQVWGDPTELLGVPETLKTIQFIAGALGYLLEHDWVNHAGTNLEVSLLLASFHGALRCRGGC